ncbi:Txe/YoeB family addiction module toxin [Azospirillum sp. sgz302134]
MILLWTEDAWDDYLHWQEHDPDIVQRVNALIKDTKRNPFKGIGKPEPLKESLKGWWSRRITGEHRLVYRVTGTGADQRLEIIQCRFHY